MLTPTESEYKVGYPYTVVWEGQEYRLSLRTAPDGYLSGADRVAAESIVAAYVNNAGVVMGEAAATAQIFDALAKVELNGERVAAPWPSWLDIPDAVSGGLLNDFFFSYARKARKSFSSPWITETLAVLELIFAPRTISGTRSPAPPRLSGTQNGTSATVHGHT